MDDLIYLVGQTWTQNDFGGQVPAETLTPVWAHLQSVTRAEWSEAGQNGLQPQLVAITPRVNYSGQEIVQIGTGEDARRYGIYRTYFGPDSDLIELYLEAKVGVSYGK